MNINQKKALYEQIMRSVSKEVKKTLNEEHVSVRNRRKSRSLNEKMKYLTDIRYGRESHTAVCDYKDGIDIQYVDIDKMIDYYNKQSKPERLVKSISDQRKLIARWAVAIMMEWYECADVFENEIRTRRLLTTNKIDNGRVEMEKNIAMFKEKWGWYMRVRN